MVWGGGPRERQEAHPGSQSAMKKLPSALSLKSVSPTAMPLKRPDTLGIYTSPFAGTQLCSYTAARIEKIPAHSPPPSSLREAWATRTGGCGQKHDSHWARQDLLIVSAGPCGKGNMLLGTKGVCVCQGHSRQRDPQKQRYGNLWNPESSSGTTASGIVS